MNIHGQSFLLNQIRKMLGMAIAVYRGVAPRNGIEIATDPQRNFGTPLAPEINLLLSECLYEAYNARRKAGFEHLNVEEWAGKIERFKKVRQALDATVMVITNMTHLHNNQVHLFCTHCAFLALVCE
jgi:hypothetical protein